MGINQSSQIAMTQTTINNDVEIYNRIKQTPSNKEQLKKVASEFESIFVTKMLETMEKTVDKESGIFGSEGDYMKNFKSFMYNQLGRDIAQNPKTSFGFAEQIYKQMEKYVGE